MNNYKRILLTGLATLVLTACGGSSSSSEDGTSTSTEPPVVTSSFDVLKEMHDGDALTSIGNYTGTGTHYYDLSLPNGGNLVSHTKSSGSSSLWAVKIHDENLNLIKDGSYDGEPDYLKAGKYIISINFGSAGGIVTLNSNGLYNQSNLPQVPLNSHTGSGVKYYKFTMAETGNIIIDTSSTSATASKAIHIYDINLNLLREWIYDGTPYSFKAGSYVIAINYDKTGIVTIKK